MSPTEPEHPPAEPTCTSSCPLCGDEHAQVLERIPRRDLEHEYRRQMSVSVEREFPRDVEELRLRRCGRCGLEYFDPLIAGSAEFYAGLSLDDRYYSSTRWEFTEALKRLPPDPDLVDVGCGDGFFLRLVPGERRRGIELNPEAARRARESGLRVEEIRLESLPAESADFVTMFQVLEHVPNPLEVLRAVERVLRPGGKLLVAVPNNDTWVGRAPPNPLNAPPHHPLRWRADALRHVSRVAALELEELLEEPLAPEHLFPYRRSEFIAMLGRVSGRSAPRYGLTRGGVMARRLSTVWAKLSVKLAPRGPRTPGTGHSVMAIYRKPGSGGEPASRGNGSIQGNGTSPGG